MTKPVAVIEIGSTGVRLLVAQSTNGHKNEILDKSEWPVSLGRDVFTTGTISRNTLLLCLQILKRFVEQLKGHGIKAEETTVIATSAIREASNRDPVVDRIKVTTGFTVQVIDGIEENRLMYLAVMDSLKYENINVQQHNSIIIEVGGGSTEIMLIEKGRVAGAHSMRLGTVIIEQQLNTMLGATDDAKHYINEFISNTKDTLNYELNLGNIQQFIAVGAEANLAARVIDRNKNTSCHFIDRESFESFIEEVQKFPSIEESMAHFQISHSEAQGLLLSLVIYQQFMKLTNVSMIIVPETSIREGLIIRQTAFDAREIKAEFDEQIIASARNLLRKYRGDEKHADFVRMICLKIFDTLHAELGIEQDARSILEVSAMLHDIGMFIRASDHEIHSKYIISHSEIFGLNKDEITVISQIASYHRGSLHPQEDSQYKSLPRSDRLMILKLASILRVADALDRSHQQRIKDFTLSLSSDSLTIRVKGNPYIILEKMAITDKGDLFESVFGYKIVLV
ncbi:MAG: HD domain-containing protein [Treponema sp.]|nr:HD domain-containing protein [Treponema sp.]